MMGVTLLLLLLSHLNLGHMIQGLLTPELNQLETVEGLGARSMSTQQSSNTVPMIGKKASSQNSNEDSPKFLSQIYPYLIRFLEFGMRERQSYPEIGKRSGKPDFEYPPWLKMDLARIGKRGFPRFSIPESWKKVKSLSKPSLSKLRQEMFSGSSSQRNKRSALPGGIFSMSWTPGKDSQLFRFHHNNNPWRRAMMFKRGENHVKDFNSVPFMGKRSEEKGDVGVKLGDDLMVRRPRYNDYYDYGDEDIDMETDDKGYQPNPWTYINLEAQIQNGLI